MNNQLLLMKQKLLNSKLNQQPPVQQFDRNKIISVEIEEPKKQVSIAEEQKNKMNEIAPPIMNTATHENDKLSLLKDKLRSMIKNVAASRPEYAVKNQASHIEAEKCQIHQSIHAQPEICKEVKEIQVQQRPNIVLQKEPQIQNEPHPIIDKHQQQLIHNVEAIPYQEQEIAEDKKQVEIHEDQNLQEQFMNQIQPNEADMHGEEAEEEVAVIQQEKEQIIAINPFNQNEQQQYIQEIVEQKGQENQPMHEEEIQNNEANIIIEDLPKEQNNQQIERKDYLAISSINQQCDKPEIHPIDIHKQQKMEQEPVIQQQVVPEPPNKLKLLMEKMKKMKGQIQKPVEKSHEISKNNESNQPQSSDKTSLQAPIQVIASSTPNTTIKNVQNQQQVQQDKQQQEEPLINQEQKQLPQPEEDDDDDEGYESQIVQRNQQQEEDEDQQQQPEEEEADEEQIRIESKEKDVPDKQVNEDEEQAEQQINQEVNRDDDDVIEEEEHRPSKKQQKKNKIVLKELNSILTMTKKIKSILGSKFNQTIPKYSGKMSLMEMVSLIKQKIGP